MMNAIVEMILVVVWNPLAVPVNIVLRKSPMKFPSLKYPVILADPPWLFKNWSAKGEAKNPNQHYDCMTIEEICALPVTFAAEDDCALFLWCTWPTLLTEVPRVLKAWGFEYKGLAWEWVKYNPVTEKFAFGGGYGTRKNCEPCILATRGNPQRKSKSERDFMFCDDELDVMFSPRREHSRKPDAQYERIEALFDGPYLELFGRQQKLGWDVWGNQSDKFGAVA